MTYDRPFRLRVLDALTDVLRGITPANGYSHDLSQAVFRGRDMFGDNDPLPMVSILEQPQPPQPFDEPPEAMNGRVRWDLLVQGFVEDDPVNPTDPAYFLLADVKNALAKERQNNRDFNILGFKGLKSQVTEMYIGSGVVRPADHISDKAYFWLTLSLELVEDISRPYE